MMEKRWLVSRTNPEYIRYISKAASISPALSQILISRGLKTPQDIADFFNPRLSDLSDPFGLSGMKASVERIKHAIGINESVLVHGDYDADGVTATAIMVQALRMHGLNVHYFIPNRVSHGYGFNPAAVKIAKEIGAGLIITVDCGITAFETTAYAGQEGVDVIITDHHEPIKAGIGDVGLGTNKKLNPNAQQLTPDPQFALPDAVAVINPKLETLNPKLSNLSGAGVAFKVAQALDMALGTRYAEQLLDLAAIGTMADVVPLSGENRAIVREGMKLIEAGQRPGIRALKSVAGLDGRKLRSELLSFTMIPRINAAGRIADSSNVVRLLLSDSEAEAEDLSKWLDGLNLERQKIEEEVHQEALSRINERGAGSVVVISGEGWHQGVLGIVASRIAEKFYRPAFVFSTENGIAKGSARSIPSFDLFLGLTECSAGAEELLLAFGGHKQAAGVKLKADKIRDFEEMISGILDRTLSKEDLIPFVEIDADITLSEANHNLIREIAMLEPLGYGNEEPYLGSRGLEVLSPRIVGNNHLKMRLKQGAQSIDAIGFDMAGPSSPLLAGESAPPDTIDAVYTLNINEYNGNRYLQLNLKAFRTSK